MRAALYSRPASWAARAEGPEQEPVQRQVPAEPAVQVTVQAEILLQVQILTQVQGQPKARVPALEPVRLRQRVPAP